MVRLVIPQASHASYAAGAQGAQAWMPDGVWERPGAAVWRGVGDAWPMVSGDGSTRPKAATRSQGRCLSGSCAWCGQKSCVS